MMRKSAYFKPDFRSVCSATLAVFMFSILLTLSACGGGAVVFAPTPAPPDTSPAVYTHPSGAFSLSVPRQWSRYELNTTTLASASFSPPGEDAPALLIAAVNLGDSTRDFAAIIDQYQSQIRPDTGTYTEQSREAMGDGSWRLTGLRTLHGGAIQQVNTFIQRAGAVVGIIDLPVPSENSVVFTQIQTIVNTFTLNPDANLDVAPLTTLAFAKESDLALLHVSAWTTPTGVFYLTGEVANYGMTTVTNLPIEAVLVMADGASVAGAVDTVMGYGIPPGGFAPFSLRFGEGRGTLATDYTLRLGKDWIATPDAVVIGDGSLVWTDEADFNTFNQLVITGRVTNTGSVAARQPRAIVTVFDGAQNVIGAVWSDLPAELIVPGASVDFEVIVGEYGGDPENYILTVQGLL